MGLWLWMMPNNWWRSDSYLKLLTAVKAFYSWKKLCKLKTSFIETWMLWLWLRKMPTTCTSSILWWKLLRATRCYRLLTAFTKPTSLNLPNRFDFAKNLNFCKNCGKLMYQSFFSLQITAIKMRLIKIIGTLKNLPIKKLPGKSKIKKLSLSKKMT